VRCDEDGERCLRPHAVPGESPRPSSAGSLATPLQRRDSILRRPARGAFSAHSGARFRSTIPREMVDPGGWASFHGPPGLLSFSRSFTSVFRRLHHRR